MKVSRLLAVPLCTAMMSLTGFAFAKEALAEDCLISAEFDWPLSTA